LSDAKPEPISQRSQKDQSARIQDRVTAATEEIRGSTRQAQAALSFHSQFRKCYNDYLPLKALIKTLPIFIAVILLI